MKLLVKIPLILIAVLIFATAFMAIFSICPPSGPWLMPPWCKAVSTGTSAGSWTPLAAFSKTADLNLTVTVPYWTEGDVYLGVGDNATYLKLDKVNEVTYTGVARLEKRAPYYYSEGAGDTREVSADRTAAGEKIFDAVIDWEGSSKEISKAGFEKGFYIGACHTCGVSITKGNFIEPFNKAYDDIKQAGANWVNFVPVWFITPDYTGNELKPIYAEDFKGTSGWVYSTIKDEDLIKIINDAHAKGLKVYLAPHVAPENWGPGIKGKGDLEPSNVDLFFASYTNFINHYAEIAQQTGVEMFSIGNELDSVTQTDSILAQKTNPTPLWRNVIKAVREKYKGTLTYSVSCMNEKRCGPELIDFWDDLDVIGFEWYVPIATAAHESITSMKTNAERILENHVKTLSDKYKKPVVFTEIGWNAYPGVCANTYSDSPSKGGDRIEQSSCYEAIFQAIENKDFIKGMIIWTWTANLEGDEFPWIWTDAVGEVRFSITEKEITKWYSKIEN